LESEKEYLKGKESEEKRLITLRKKGVIREVSRERVVGKRAQKNCNWKRAAQEKLQAAIGWESTELSGRSSQKGGNLWENARLTRESLLAGKVVVLK